MDREGASDDLLADLIEALRHPLAGSRRQASRCTPRQNPQDDGIRFYAIRFPAQVSSLVEVLDAIPDAERAAVVAASQRPQVRLELRADPLAHLDDSTDPYAILLRRRIEVLSVVPRVVIVASRPELRIIHRRVGPGVRQAGMAVLDPRLGVGDSVGFSGKRLILGLFWRGGRFHPLGAGEGNGGPAGF